MGLPKVLQRVLDMKRMKPIKRISLCDKGCGNCTHIGIVRICDMALNPSGRKFKCKGFYCKGVKYSGKV
jgi:hypothetical protein